MALPPDAQQSADAANAAAVRRGQADAPEILRIIVRQVSSETAPVDDLGWVEVTTVELAAEVLEIRQSAMGASVGDTLRLSFQRQILLGPGEAFRNPMHPSVGDVVWAYLIWDGEDFRLAAGSGSLVP